MPCQPCPLCKAAAKLIAHDYVGPLYWCSACGVLAGRDGAGLLNYEVPQWSALATQLDFDHLAKQVAGAPWTGLGERTGAAKAAKE